MFCRFFLIVLLAFCVCDVSAQFKISSEYTLNGLLVDDLSGKPIADVNIACIYLPKGTTSGANGRFTLTVTKGMSLRFSTVAYEELEREVPDSILDLGIRWVVPLHSALYQLSEVQVVEDKAVPLAYRSDVFKEKPALVLVLFKPISYFYYYFGKREKRKREILAAIEQERLLQHYADIIGESQIAELTRLEGDDLERCVMYCNGHLVLSSQDTESTVRNKLMLTLTDYYHIKQQNHETNSGIRIDH